MTATAEEIEKFKISSEIGSHHWFQTYMGNIIRRGEFIEQHPDHPLVTEYAKEIKETSLFMSKCFKDINP